MSLIADALKAAQQERTDRSGGAASARERQAAASALRTSADFSPARGASGKLPPALWISLAVFAVATTGAVAFVLRIPSSGEIATVAIGSQTPEFAETGALVDRQTQLAYVDLGALPADPSEGTYDESSPLNGEFPLEEPVESPLPAPGNMTPRASAVAASAQEPLVSDETPVESVPRPAAPSTQQQIERENVAAPAPPPGRFEIRLGNAAARSTPSFDAAVAAQHREDYRTAVQNYLEILEADGANVEALNNLGASYQALGDLTRAKQAFEQAVAIAPAYAAAWSNLGVVLGAMGVGQEALTALSEAVRLEPLNSGSRVNLALAYERVGRTADARRILEEVVRAEPQHAEAHYAVGRILEAAGDRSGAASHYRVFLTFGSSRFPHLDVPVRERIRMLEEANGR